MAGNIICSKCGQQNGPDQTFCSSCGAFLEWSAEKAAGEEAGAPAPATPPAGAGSELAGLARSRPSRARRAADSGPTAAPPAGGEGTGSVARPASQPPLVSPVRSGPSRQSVPSTPLESDLPGQASAASAAVVSPAEATIACPACGRANPAARNFCHSCGTLLRPRPRAPMARRRRAAGSPYRLLSIILLVAIILVGSFLVTRLTTSKGGSAPSPSPSRSSITLQIGG